MFESYRMLGLRLHPLTAQALLTAVAQAIDQNTQRIIGHHNLHSAYLMRHDAKLRQFHEVAQIGYIDGMPLVLMGRLLGYPLHRAHRITLLDFLPAFLDVAARHGWRIFWLGGEPGVSERGAASLCQQHEGLQLLTHHGYFDLEGPENNRLVQHINASNVDVLMVGMGMPRQEQWVLENRHRLNPCVIWCCGATMDYIAGAIPTPPRWMGRVGLEWLYRLCSEPGRLWKRYLVEPWALAPLVVGDLWRHLRGRHRD
jgi:N-acetylglucosaminyldiphosphoundecaprenol N-acetyl-beta-D-mannosaminyltransferase